MFSWMESPVGRLALVSDGDAVSGLYFEGFDASALCQDDGLPILVEAKRQLDAYFARELRTFALPLAPRGTDFQLRVWDLLKTIPYGSTTTYGALAVRLGTPGASRAVGLANGQNPISIIVPCHRVIGAGGALTGYGGGLPAKRALLQLEAGGGSLFAASTGA